MCSIFWWILYTWEALGCICSLIHALATRGRKEGGEKLLCTPGTYPKCQGGACAILLHFWLFGVWSAVWNRSDRLWEPAWPVFGGTGLTGYWNRSDRFVPRVGTWSGGACICAGGALVCFGGLCSLLELCFVLDVSSRCPCLRGPRLVFFKWSCSLPLFGFRLLVGVFLSVSFLFSFSLYLPDVCVVNALIKGEIEDHVWFEDRWMVASLCDEWLTTLCGLILG
jgi:hypothetical protein